MKKTNPVIENMPRSGIRVILDEANKLEDVLHLEIGQPDFATPDHIIEAAHQAAIDGFTGYTPNAGFGSLREAFADHLKIEYGIHADSEQIVVTAGAMGALFNAFSTLVSPGDEVLIPDPGYPNYSMALQFLRAKPVAYPLGFDSSQFYLDPDVIEQSITKKTKAIVLNSPSNPTGLVADEKAIIRIVEVAHKHGLYIISDEAYDHIIFNGAHHSPLKFGREEHIIAVYSCSKTYAMTGWRVGFAVAPAEICRLMSKLQEAYIACAPSISQKAAEAALKGPQSCVSAMNASYQQRRDLAIRICSELKINCVLPNGAFYLMVALPEPVMENSMQFSLDLVKQSKLAVAPGITFGERGEGFIRLALCAKESVLKEGLSRLSSVFDHKK